MFLIPPSSNREAQVYFIDIFQQRSDKGALKTVKISAEDRTKCLDSQLRQDGQHSASAVLCYSDPWLGTRVSVCVQSADVGPPLSRYLLSVHCPLHSDTQPTHQLSRGHSRLVNHQMDL